MMKNTKIFLPVAFLILMLQYGCGIIDYAFLKPPEDTARELAEAGSESMQSKNYGKAIDYYTKLKERYPFSPYTTSAELQLADAYFLDGQYKAAEASYKEFESVHPRHEAIPYVLFQIGKANYNQFKSIDRPLEDVDEALQYFRRLEEGYPDTDYAEKAREYIKASRKRMAEHELYVARYYWGQNDWGPAWKRYEYVAENFSDLPEVREYARERADQAYLKFRVSSSKKERESAEGTWKSWFRWL
ncbi:MAG: outer membrane protein assembly factor BamD [Desulfovibrionales bacterium]